MFSEWSTIVLNMENNIIFPSNIFKSKTRQKILRLFFTNPKSKFYVRQLQGMFNVSIGNLHRELKNLEGMGVLKSEEVGNLKFYLIDKKYPLHKELKGIVAKTIGVEGSLREALKGIEGIKTAFIHGSFATGKEIRESDIDLFIIGRFDEDLLNKELEKLEHYLAREINYTQMTKSEYELDKKKKSHFLKTVLNEPKTFLVGDEDGL